MRRVILSILAAAAVAWPTATHRLLAGKSPDPTPAEATFRDWQDDKIKSDGGGKYVDGQKRSVCHIFTGASEDLTIGTFQSGRTMWFYYTPASDVTQPTANPPTGTLQDNAFVNIHNIGAMAVTETKVTRASFGTAVGHFRWLEGTYGSQAVVVQRSSRTHWSVWADPAPMALPSGGDLAVLLKDGPKLSLTPVGLYHMPFGLEVECPNCP